MMASSPATSARKAPRKTIASTKMYCEILSSKFLKNHLAINGNKKKTMLPKMTEEIMRRIQNVVVISPFTIPVIVAKTSSARMSVIIVPPIVRVTDLVRANPYLLAIGYASNVCVANMLDNRMEEVIEKPKI